MYCGDTTYSTQLLIEIFSNAVDEFRLGHGNEINVEVNLDTGVCSVKDKGQGFIPNSKREDGATILEAAFSVLNTSGKYREDGAYEGTSLGSFGIGSKITTYLSHWLAVSTTREDTEEIEAIKFTEGVFDNRKIEKGLFKTSGTVVQWLPSEEFFTHIEPNIEELEELFRTVSCLCKGLKIEFTVIKNKNTKVTNYYSEKGLSDLLNQKIKAEDELIRNRMEMNFEEGKYKMDLLFTYTDKYSSTIVPYVNTGLTESGPHITQIKTVLTREMNKFFREKKILKEKDSNLTGDDIQEGLYLVFNITAPSVSYDAQVKSRITSIEMKPFVTAFAESLQNWMQNNEKEVKGIADKALLARKAREAAKRAREATREKKAKQKKALKFDSKLADCYSKDRSKCEIYVTEGDSASGNLKIARNNEFQAVMPVRGKILNVRKATLDKIQKNAEIMSMIEAFGLSVDMNTMKLTYEPDDLRYDKIIIESDADVDGSHIKNLFYTFIWTFCPQLILDGHVYAGVPPLYKITKGKDTYIYLKDDTALKEFSEKNKGSKYTVNRLKGLGEMSAEETSILVDEDKRIIKQITVEDVEKADKLFDDLMGTAVIPRKEFIKEHSAEATYAV